MGIHTNRPGGGEDGITIYRADSAENAKKARVALEGAGIPVDMPDQAIDVWFATKPGEIFPVKVAIKDSGKALKAISAAIPREEPATPISQAANPNKAAEEVLVKIEAPAAPSDPDVMPPGAVERWARRGMILSFMSITFPPLGLVAAVIGVRVLLEMNGRKGEDFRKGPVMAKVATAFGLLTGIMETLLIAHRYGRI
jgi:hypothetical protein